MQYSDPLHSHKDLISFVNNTLCAKSYYHALANPVLTQSVLDIVME